MRSLSPEKHTCLLYTSHWEIKPDGNIIPGKEYHECSFAAFGTHDFETIMQTWNDSYAKICLLYTSGYETAALLILGVVLLCVEFFVIPGTFIAVSYTHLITLCLKYRRPKSFTRTPVILSNSAWRAFTALAASLLRYSLRKALRCV